VRDLLVITPTRRRPGSAVRLAAACRATCRARTDLVFAVDDDDGSYDGLDLAGAATARGPRRSCGEWTNLIAARYGGGYRALASLGDDHEPLTPGWDTMLLAAIDGLGGTGIAYGDDTLQGRALPTAPVITASIPAALGWLMRPGWRYFCDNAWKALGERAGCLAYVPEVTVRHYHYTFGTAPRDATYAEAEPGFDRDRAAFAAWAADPAGLAASARIIRELAAGGAPG
jgi:hypothetical protein